MCVCVCVYVCVCGGGGVRLLARNIALNSDIAHNYKYMFGPYRVKQLILQHPLLSFRKDMPKTYIETYQTYLQ